MSEKTYKEFDPIPEGTGWGELLEAGEKKLDSARATIAELEKRIGELEHDAESFECAMMVLDDLRVPREDSGGEVYSLVGRIQQALTAERQRREDCETALRQEAFTFACGDAAQAYFRYPSESDNVAGPQTGGTDGTA